MAARFSGKPGETWTNDTGKVQYQFICNFSNSCGVCAQYAGMIGPSWPIPYHHSCRCRQLMVPPGGTSQPFVDYLARVADLDPAQQARVMGASNYKLVSKGIVEWKDVVTEGRIRDLREVVSLKKLDVKTLVKAGVPPRIAEDAFQSVHTAAHDLAEQSRQRIFAALKAKGLSVEQTKQAIAERLAGRVSIGEGPSGPMPSKIKPGPLPLPVLADALKVKIVPQAIGPAFTIHGDVSLTLQAEAREAIAELPEQVRQVLADHGVTVRLGHAMADVAPELAGQSPRGWPEGMTWSNADGAYYTPGKRIVATETYQSYYESIEVVSKRTVDVLRHETGHAFDSAIGNASYRKEFRAAYARDVAKLSEIGKARVGYFLQSGYAGPQETFAELFAQEHGGGAEKINLRQLFPEAHEVVRGHIESPRAVTAKRPKLVSVPVPPGKEHFVGKLLDAKDRAFTDSVEKSVAKGIGGTWDSGYAPYDASLKKQGGGKHFVEIKSLIKGKKQSLSMHADALLRKVEAAGESPGSMFHTVAEDHRKEYNGGKNSANFSGHKLYYRRGAGPYSLSTMHPVKNYTELQRLIRMPDSKLPEKAKGSLPTGKEAIARLREQAATADASRKAKDARRDRKKKPETSPTSSPKTSPLPKPSGTVSPPVPAKLSERGHTGKPSMAPSLTSVDVPALHAPEPVAVPSGTHPMAVRLKTWTEGDTLVENLSGLGKVARIKGKTVKRVEGLLADAISAHATNPGAATKAEMDGLRLALRDAAIAAERVGKQAREAVLKHITVADPMAIKTHAPSTLHPDAKASAESAVGFLGKVVAKSGSEEVNVKLKSFSPNRANRAYFDIDKNTVHVNASERPDVVIHELGHMLEAKVPGWGKAARDFLEYRTAGDSPVALNSIFPGQYDADEKGRSDRFGEAFGRQAHYVGKHYDDATEITSMGLQKLHEDPVGFAEKDPEYVKFLLGLLRGTLR